MGETSNITADAMELQERDEFCADGWLKVLAPAKVNLHLAVGGKRSDGYHEVTSILHALNLHDIVYVRKLDPGAHESTHPKGLPHKSGTAPHAIVTDASDAAGQPGASSRSGSLNSDGQMNGEPVVRMIGCGDVVAPDVAMGDNLASQAVRALAKATGQPIDNASLELRIEKNIPVEAGLGGGSTDAAAALVAAATLWGINRNDPILDATARTLGADVAFFLTGGCACYEGAGNVFTRALEPSKQAVVLVKPSAGVSTRDAYRAFDKAPEPVPSSVAENGMTVPNASDVMLFNNLAAAAERLVPGLADIRTWLEGQPGVSGALLCGSGAATFALCKSFSHACSIVSAARKRGWWARATSFGSARAMVISGPREAASAAGERR